MANKMKTQEKLMNALEKSLLALANSDTSSNSKELKSLGRIMSRKGPTSKKKPDQVLYTVIKGKKCHDEDYVSMPVKKAEPLKKEQKKSKRTPVNFPISSARLGDSASHLVTHRPAPPPPVPEPAPAPVNQWNARTGADLFTSPAARRMQNFNSGLDYEDELAMVIAESIRSAQNEEKVRDLYFEQHYQAQQLLEHRPRPTYEAPPKEVSYSSRNNDPFYFDDVPTEVTPQDYYHSETTHGYDSEDDWTTVPSSHSRPGAKQPVTKSHESSCATNTEKKKAKKSEKKAKEEVDWDDTTEKKSKKKPTETVDSSAELVLESGKKKRKKSGSEESKPSAAAETTAKSTGAIKKTKPAKTKTEEKRTLDDVDSGMKPGLANDAPKRTKSESRKSKSESSNAAEMHADFFDPFPKPQRERKPAATSHKSNKKSDSSKNVLHNYGIDNDFDWDAEEDCESYGTESATHYQSNEQSDFAENAPHSYEDDNDYEGHLEEDFEPYNVENEAVAQPDPSSDDDSPSYETVSYVTINSHPHLFDPSEFLDFYRSSPDDEFLTLIQCLPDCILRYFSKYSTVPRRPLITTEHIEKVLESASHKVVSPEKLKRSLLGTEEYENNSNLKSPVKTSEESKTNSEQSYSSQPLRKPRLPGSGRLKLPSNSAETISAIQSSNSPAELQRKLLGTTDFSLKSAPQPPVNFSHSKSDLVDKFSPSLEPIYEVNGSSASSQSSKDLNADSSRANQQSDKVALDQDTLNALMASVTNEDFVDALAIEIGKLNLDAESPDFAANIEKEVAKLVEDSESSLWRYLREKLPKLPSNGEALQNAQSSSSLPSLNAGLLSPNEDIKPLPVNLAFSSLPAEGVESLSGAENVSFPYQSLPYNNNTMPQVNLNSATSPNSSFTLPAQSGPNLVSDAAENGMTALSYGSVCNQNSLDYNASDTKVPSDVMPVSVTADKIPSVETIVDILKQAMVAEAGEHASVLMSTVEFQSLLPTLAFTVQNQVKHCGAPDGFVEAFSREIVRHFLVAQYESSCLSQAQTSSSYASQTQTPPGLSLPNNASQYHYNPVSMNGLSSTSVQGPPGLAQGYPSNYVQSSLPNNLTQTNVYSTPYSGATTTGYPFATNSSVYNNNVPASFYGAGLPPSMNPIQSQIPTNINTLLK